MAGLSWIDGFDEYAATTTDCQMEGWTSAFASMQSGRFGGSCARLTSATVNTKNLPTPDASQTIGIAFRPSQLQQDRMFELMEGATIHGRILITSGGAITVSRNGSIPASSSAGIITAGNWYYLEWYYKCDDTTGAWEVKLNGSTIIGPTTGLDTRNGGTGVLDGLRCNAQSSSNLDLDDMYIYWGGSSFQGDCRVVTTLPTSDDTGQQWTKSTGATNFGTVDEATENGDTDYVSDATSNHRDAYGMPALGITGTVQGVLVRAVARKDDAGARNASVGHRIGGTDYDGTSTALAATYGLISGLSVVSPATAAAWSVSGVDAALLMIKDV